MARLSLAQPKLKALRMPLDEVVAFSHANDSYYNSKEHRAWRTLIITRANGMCQWPIAHQTTMHLAMMMAHRMAMNQRTRRGCCARSRWSGRCMAAFYRAPARAHRIAWPRRRGNWPRVRAEPPRASAAARRGPSGAGPSARSRASRRRRGSAED